MATHISEITTFRFVVEIYASTLVEAEDRFRHQMAGLVGHRRFQTNTEILVTPHIRGDNQAVTMWSFNFSGTATEG